MKQDVINLCANQGLATFRSANESLRAFVAEVGGWDKLPPKFTLNVPAMNALEDGIEQAITDGDLQKTEDLCDQYRARFTSYLDGWRRIVAKAKGAIA
jgi:hypothetical protein